MRFNKLKTSVAEQREAENMRATIAQQSATIDYIAIMSDIEIPSVEDETEGDAE